MALTYPKTEKLKSKHYIDLLFSEGKWVSSYPLRLIYVPITAEKSVFGVSVSKRNFKHAVDRNEIKRTLREAYRTNQHLLKTIAGEDTYAFMLLFTSKEKLPFAQLEQKTLRVFEKFGDVLAENNLNKENIPNEKQ